MRDGINDTAASADQTAALLQLVSSLITDVETIIRLMISDVVAWAVVIWREDAVRGRHAKLSNFHLLVSIGKQTLRSAKNGALLNFGFYQYRTEPNGNPYPDGRRRVRVRSYQISDGNGGVRGAPNHLGVLGSAASTVLPFGRAVQYWGRGGGAPSGDEIDRELDLWGTTA